MPLEIGRIIPMFCNDNNAIHRKFLTAKSDGFPYCFKDGNVFRFAYFLGKQACIQLMDVNGHHIHSRRSVCALPPITVYQLVYDPVRM